MPSKYKMFCFAMDRAKSDELIQRVAEEICGLRVSRVKMIDVRRRLETFKGELDATRSESPKQLRDRLEELAGALESAAKAVAEAPQDLDNFFDGAVRRETGLSSTALANALHELSEETSARLRGFLVPRAGNVNDEKLCAHFTRLLFDEMSGKRPTMTTNGAFVAAAGLVAELFLGPDARRSMTTACREVLEGRFPAAPPL